MSDQADHHQAPWRSSPLVWAAGCWGFGIIAGRSMGAPAGLWLGGAAVCLLLAGMAWMRRRRDIGTASRPGSEAGSARFGRCTSIGCEAVGIGAAALAVAAASAAWWQMRAGPLPGAPSIPVSQQSRLVELEGLVEGEPHIRTRNRGLMGRFDYRSPRTSFVLRADRLHLGAESRPLRLGVLVSIPAYDSRLRPGDRVRCIGWLSAFSPPGNPGEADYGRRMAGQGVFARLSPAGRGNCRIVERAGGLRGLAGRWRQGLRMMARDALRVGLETGPSNPRTRNSELGTRNSELGTRNSGGAGPRPRLPGAGAGDRPVAALLGVLLLGEGREDLGELDRAFRHTGLAHLLAISGLHVGILAAGTWWLTLALTGRPRWGAAVVLAVLVLYLLIVPPRVPIIRAAVMTAAAVAALTWGRRISAMAAMAAAALALLVWRPGDLFSPGFQLSFTVVAALILFTGRVSGWLMPRPLLGPQRAGRMRWMALRRYGADYLAVGIVAWTAAMPLIAYHFHYVSPLAIGLTVLVLPLVALLLWVGYLKILLSVLWAGAGALLAAPLWGLGELTAALVGWAESAPTAVVWTPQPSVLWAAAMTAAAAALFAGRFAGRPKALAVCGLLCIGWLFAPAAAERLDGRHALRLNMLAVGDGSCYLVRSGGEAMVFDCGSGGYTDITTVSVGPALRALGVVRVPMLVLSHPDTDHFSGALELIDRFGVERVLTNAQFARTAASQPNGAAAFLLREVERRGVAIETIGRGWERRLGHATVRAIWPPAGRDFGRDNDSSLVLSIRAGGRRVLLCGDVQEEAMRAMLDEGLDLRADVAELPHHGSFVPIAPRWLAAVGPSIVLQSTGPDRLRDGPWPPHLGGASRHITARHGMTALTIGHDGRIAARRFREDAEGKVAR